MAAMFVGIMAMLASVSFSGDFCSTVADMMLSAYNVGYSIGDCEGLQMLIVEKAKVLGASNGAAIADVAHSACSLGVIDRVAGQYRPLFVYSAALKACHTSIEEVLRNKKKAQEGKKQR